MDCKLARQLLPFDGARGELDTSDRLALADHLDACPDCAALSADETAFDVPVARTMRSVPVPPDLRGRLLAALDRQRIAYHRHGWLQAGAAAAAVLVAVAIGYVASYQPPTELNPARIAQAWDARVGESPREVEQWFREQGTPMVAPLAFNYAYLKNHQIVEFEGRRRVPQLRFEREGVTAYVLVVRSDQFDLSPQRLKASAPYVTSHYTVSVELAPPRPEGPQFAFVVFVAGGPIESLLQQDAVIARA